MDDHDDEHPPFFPAGGGLPARDAEFAAYWTRAVVHEVPDQVELPVRDQRLVQVSAVLACGGPGMLRVVAGRALDAGVTVAEVQEAAYQAVAYVGAGHVVEHLAVLDRLAADRGVPDAPSTRSTTTPATREERGLAVQRSIGTPAKIEALYRQAAPDAVRVQRLMTATCFGDVFTRAGLDVATRELLVFAVLVALGGLDDKVRGHVACNRDQGRDRRALLDVLVTLAPFVGWPRTVAGLAAVDAVMPADGAAAT